LPDYHDYVALLALSFSRDFGARLLNVTPVGERGDKRVQLTALTSERRHELLHERSYRSMNTTINAELEQN
jgi:hypothetical protein